MIASHQWHQGTGDDDDDEEGEVGVGIGAGKEGEGEIEGEETKEMNPEDGQVASSILSKVRDPLHAHLYFTFNLHHCFFNLIVIMTSRY